MRAIRILPPILVLAAGLWGGSAAAKGGGGGLDDLQVRAIDIGSLAAPEREPVAPPLGFFPLRAPWFLPSPGASAPGDDLNGGAPPPAGFSRDEVVELLGGILGREEFEAWEADGRIATLPSILLARLRPEALDEIRRVVAWLEDWTQTRIPLGAFLFRGEPDLRPGVLDAASVRAILGGKKASRPVASYRGVAIPGRRVTLGRVEERSYVADYDVEVAQSATIADPVVRVLRTGVQLQIRAHLLASGTVALDAAFSAVRPELPLRREDAHAGPIGEIQLPVLESHRIGLRVALPDGGGVLVRVLAGEADVPSWLLVTAGPVRRPRGRIEVAGREVGLFPIGFLTGVRDGFRSPPRSLGLALEEPLEESGGLGDDEAREGFVDEGDVAGGIEENLLRPSGEPGAEVLFVRSDLVAVAARGETLDRVAAYLAALEALAARQVSVDATLYRADAAAFEAALEQLADSPGGGAGPWTLDQAEARRLRGRLGPPAGIAALTTLHATPAAVFRGSERAVLADYDVEIAQDAAVADPIIRHLNDGFSLDVLPFIDTGGTRVTLHLRGRIARGGSDGLEGLNGEGLGAIDRLRRETLRMRADPVLQAGETHVQVVERAGTDVPCWILLVRARPAPAAAPPGSER